jgi:hypothetical protein
MPDENGIRVIPGRVRKQIIGYCYTDKVKVVKPTNLTGGMLI